MQTVTLRESRKSMLAIIFSIVLVLSMCLPYLIGVKTASADSNDKVVLGYYASWAPPGDDFDPNKITHLNYSFGSICWDGEQGNPLNEEIAEGEQKVWPCTDLDGEENKELPNGTIVMYEPEVDLVELPKVAALKNQNPNLKTLLSIGGWTLSHNLSDVAADEEARQVLADSAVDFIREFNMDGLDLDWEYPIRPDWGAGHPGNAERPEDPENFLQLVKDIRAALDAAEAEDGKKYLLTMAGGQQDWFIDGLPLAQVAEHMDYLAVMTYDTNGTWDTLTGHNAPLGPIDGTASEVAARGWTNGNVGRATIKMDWAGVPKDKIVVGLAFYGQAWKGCNPDDEGAYNVERGAHQNCTGGSAGIDKGYGAIKQLVNKDGYDYFWDNEAKVPYLYNVEKGEFVSYDNIESLQYKVNHILDNGLGGAMIWDLATDDAEWNLLKTVSYGLGVSSDEPTPDPEQPAFDLSELRTLINEAKEITNDDSEYTEESFANLQKAIADAEVALDTIETEEKLAEAIASLLAALEALEANEEEKEEPTPTPDPELDLSELEALIDEAKEITNDEDEYTEESFADLESAIEAADAALDAIETVEELEIAIANLQAAIDALEKVEVKPTPKPEDPFIEDNGDNNDEDAKPESNGDNDGLELPKTATNTFNLIAIGAFILLTGSIALFYGRKRDSTEE